MVPKGMGGECFSMFGGSPPFKLIGGIDVPKVTRPKSWEGCAAYDVLETARQLGRTENAVRLLIKKKKLKKLDTGDHRVMVAATAVEAFKRQQPPRQLRLLKATR